MWAFLQYTSKEQAFKGLFQASKTVLKIWCKSSLVYLSIARGVVGMTTTGRFIPGSLSGWLNNLSPDLRDEEESRKAIEGCSLREQPQPQTKVILGLISSKNTLLNKLADKLDVEKLEL